MLFLIQGAGSRVFMLAGARVNGVVVCESEDRRVNHTVRNRIRHRCLLSIIFV